MKKFLSGFLIAALLASPALAAGQRPADMTTNPGIASTDIVWCPRGTSADYKCAFSAITAYLNALFSGDATVDASSVITLKNTGPGATGPLGSATVAPIVTIDAKGRVTALTSATVTPAESSVTFTDITTNNVSTTKHGYAPKAPNDATQYLDGTGAYSVPAGGGGGGTNAGYAAGRYYLPIGPSGSTTGAVLLNTNQYCTIGFTALTTTIQELGVQVTTAGGNVQLGIYNHDTTTGLPSTLIDKTGSIVATGTGVVVGLMGSSQQLTSKWYWFCVQTDNSSVVLASYTPAGLVQAQRSGSTVSAVRSGATAQLTGYSIPATYGTWSSNISAATFTELVSARAPMVQFKIISTP